MSQTENNAEKNCGSEKTPTGKKVTYWWAFSRRETPHSEYIKKHIIFSLFFFSFYIFVEKLSSGILIASIYIKLYDLTLPLMTALLIMYRRKSLPVLILVVFYCICAHPVLQSLETVSQWCAALISSMLYFNTTGKQGSASFGRSRLTVYRIGWLVCFNTLVYTLIHWWLLQQLRLLTAANADIFSLATLINIQWMLTSCITGVPLCYLVLRSVCKPAWFIGYLKQIKMLIVFGPRLIYQLFWLFLIGGIMFCLISTETNALILTDYSLLWLLPLMLWGTTCIGHALVSPLWVLMLFLLSDYVDNYISVGKSINFVIYLSHLAFSSSMIFIFSLTIVIVGVLSSRARTYIRHLKHMLLSEPNTGLPNVQALKKDIINSTGSGLCMIQCPELNTLTQTHGIAFRFEFVKSLSAFIKPLMKHNERIYYSPGYGILLRLQTIDNDIINTYFKAISSFRFTWVDMEIGLNLGLAYMEYNSCVNDLSLIIGHLNASTFISLQQGKPEAFSLSSPGDNVINPRVIRHILQKSIDRQSFTLVAQPIISTKNKSHYYEVLIRMATINNKLFFPDSFLPLAHDAGLLAKIDMTVIEQTFRFMQSREETQPLSQFSINLTPQSLVKTDFLSQLKKLFEKYTINPNRIIFEIIESEIVDSVNALNVLCMLRKLGCKIAIDDFGTGASSFSRLKNLEADIMKIDGSFIRNIIDNEFDHHTVVSFCDTAKLKKMEVVAEFVENEEIKKMLTKIGVDWLQGYHTGKPIPIDQVIF